MPRRYLHLLHSPVINNITIECNEIDGVVLGSWTNVDESPTVSVVDNNNPRSGYWAAAAVWFSDWDQRTIDRVSNFSYFTLTFIGNLQYFNFVCCCCCFLFFFF